MKTMTSEMKTLVGKIVVLKDRGNSFRDIAYALNLPEKTVKDLWNSYRRFVYGRLV